MEDKIGRYFGIVIGVVIPGFVGLYAVGFFVPVVGLWLGLIAQQSTGIGGFLFALFGSIGMGLFLGGLRAIIMDRYFRSPSPPNFSLRREAAVEAAYANVVAAHYVYYQFYSGMMFAVFLLYVAWLSTWPSTGRVVAMSIALIVGEVVMFLSAADAIGTFLKKRSAILNPPAHAQERHA